MFRRQPLSCAGRICSTLYFLKTPALIGPQPDSGNESRELRVDRRRRSMSGRQPLLCASRMCSTLYFLKTPALIGPQPDSARLRLRFFQVYGKMLHYRPGGEIGRRASLRCWWAQALAGSNPVPGTFLNWSTADYLPSLGRFPL